MSTPVPSPEEARAMLAGAGTTARAASAGTGARTGAWLVGTAVASWGFLTSLGIAGTSDVRVLLAALVLVVTLACLSLALLPGVRANRAGFDRRWSAAVATWGALLALVLTTGLLWMREVLAFWPLAGALVALPLALGARGELRA